MKLSDEPLTFLLFLGATLIFSSSTGVSGTGVSLEDLQQQARTMLRVFKNDLNDVSKNAREVNKKLKKMTKAIGGAADETDMGNSKQIG